ncbi:MAG: hypothetical protein RIE08_00010 [Acidimicrobiales bacterium]
MDTAEALSDIVAAATARDLPAVREEVSRLVADPAKLFAAIPEAEGPLMQPLHVADDVTVMHVVWGPRMYLGPHDHHMWACIGIYSGREDSQLYRREGSTIESSGGHSLDTGETVMLGETAIHSVHNPLGRLTGAIHVYGGAFLTEPRSEWAVETMAESPSSGQRVREMFTRHAEAYAAGN